MAYHRDPRQKRVTSEDARTTKLLQLQADQGPCLDCFSTAAPVSVPDITASSDAAARWPQFVEAVARSGTFRSVHALPLRLRGQAIGAMNLFHREPGPLPDADLALRQALAGGGGYPSRRIAWVARAAALPFGRGRADMTTSAWLATSNRSRSTAHL